MTAKEIMDMDIDTFNKLNADQLRKVNQALFDAANKRLKRLSEAGRETPAYKNAMETGGKFSNVGKDLNKLRAEYARARHFMTLKTSKLAGAKMVEKEFQKLISSDGKAPELSKSDIGRMWEAFHKLQESDPTLRGKQSARYQELISKAAKMAKRHWKSDTILKKLTEINDAAYEEEQRLSANDDEFLPIEDYEDEGIPF